MEKEVSSLAGAVTEVEGGADAEENRDGADQDESENPTSAVAHIANRLLRRQPLVQSIEHKRFSAQG